MDSAHSNSGDATHRLGAIFTHALETLPPENGANAQGGGRWTEHETDRLRFQRFEASRRESAKSKRIVIDGVIRYADKPYSLERPRPPSPEYLAFKRELEEAERMKELF